MTCRRELQVYLQFPPTGHRPYGVIAKFSCFLEKTSSVFRNGSKVDVIGVDFQIYGCLRTILKYLLDVWQSDLVQSDH